MKVSIIGSGPVGMAAALLLARQGHDATLIDRDPGPPADRPWHRVGVMQFHQPHCFRHQARQLLADQLPEVYAEVLRAGAIVASPPGQPPSAAPLLVRRSVFERAFWETVSAEARVTRLTGHVDALEIDDRGGVVGVVVDSQLHRSDLVVDAGGRASRIGRETRPVGQRVDCGMAYAARQYRLREPGALGPTTGLAEVFLHPGFAALVFGHDAGTFTVLFVRPAADPVLAQLRHPSVFDAACRVVPGLAEWTDPERSVPIDVVRAGAGLVNAYRGQPVGVTGLVAIGDAWCVTNPQGGRGITLGLQSAAALAELVPQVPPDDLARELEAWGAARLKPWFHDHVEGDASMLRSWAGHPVDPEGPMGTDVLLSAAQELRPSWMATLGGYFAMEVPPEALVPIRREVRELVRTGWQPRPQDGISRDELAALVAAQLNAATPVSA
ncbi:MAG TPA: NAD(P)/FAD-dependent oxidoreductase [Microlunatus sp.]|nr:NAD(P)/FAD-dependent oxidoreductase [Microlunatus sp.]